MSNRFNKAALLSGGAFAALALANPAFAQVADEEGATDQETAIQTGVGAEEDTPTRVTITGSRIVRNDLDTAAPVAVVQAEEFKLSGTVNAEQVINTLPQVIPGTTAFSNNPGNGTATLNLRGLGTNRNLVLVNGRRYMFFDTSQVVDLNTIPTFLVGSVDVVTGGASAVYGSDAIAGVTNFKLRYVDGLEAGGQYSITERGDGARYNVFTALGAEFDDGRGRATVYGEYYNREGVFQGDRAFSNFALGGETSDLDLLQFGSSTLPNGVIRYFGDGNRVGTDFAANRAVVFDNTPGDFRTRTGDTYNYAPVNYLMIPQERYLIGGHAEYDVGNGHTAYTEISYANNRVATELAATPVTGDFIVNLATVQPFLSPADFAQLQQLNATETDGDPDNIELFLQRRVVETGSRNSLDERNAFRILAGIGGPLTGTFNYDFYYQYARTRNANVQAGNISRSAFQAGLDGSADPINIFGPGTLTPAMVDQISILAQNGDVSALQVVSGVVSGTFGNLGFGADDLGIAIGGEYRKVSAEFIPDTALSSGDVIGFNAGQATQGSYDVKEVFAELNLPILDTAGGLSLDVTGAARYSDYSLENVGGVWTYAAGATFSPIEDITFRGQYQRAVRAPNIAELFLGQSIGFPGAVDPCGDPAIVADPTAVALCVASGVPAANVGNTGAIQLNTQIPANFAGNPDLEEEISDSITAGVVFSPRFIPGLNVTVDWYNIEVENVITTLGGGLANTLDLCFRTIQDANSPFCQPFFTGDARSTSGAITVGNLPLLRNANGALLEVEGVDFQVDYGMAAPFSIFNRAEDARFNFFFLGTYVIKNNFTPERLFPDEINECAGKFGTSACGEPTPEWKWTSRLSYIDGPATISLRWRHIGEVEDDNPNVNFSEFGGNEFLEATDYFDLSFAFDITETFTLSAGVNNLFDKLPGTPTFDASGFVTNAPLSLLLGDNQEQANTYPSTYDVLGRDFFISARMQF